MTQVCYGNGTCVTDDEDPILNANFKGMISSSLERIARMFCFACVFFFCLVFIFVFFLCIVLLLFFCLVLLLLLFLCCLFDLGDPSSPSNI